MSEIQYKQLASLSANHGKYHARIGNFLTHFTKDLRNEFLLEVIDSCSIFDAVCLKVLNRCNIERKLLRANHVTYISKALKKAIMRISSMIRVLFKKGDYHSLSISYVKEKFCNNLN